MKAMKWVNIKAAYREDHEGHEEGKPKAKKLFTTKATKKTVGIQINTDGRWVGWVGWVRWVR